MPSRLSGFEICTSTQYAIEKSSIDPSFSPILTIDVAPRARALRVYVLRFRVCARSASAPAGRRLVAQAQRPSRHPTPASKRCAPTASKSKQHSRPPDPAHCASRRYPRYCHQRGPSFIHPPCACFALTASHSSRCHQPAEPSTTYPTPTISRRARARHRSPHSSSACSRRLYPEQVIAQTHAQTHAGLCKVPPSQEFLRGPLPQAVAGSLSRVLG